MFILAGILLIAISLYLFFLSQNSLQVAMGLLRIFLCALGLIAIRFNQNAVLTAAVLLYAIASVVVLVMTRIEVQVDHD